MMISTARTGRCRPAHDASAKCDPHRISHQRPATSGPDTGSGHSGRSGPSVVETMARARAANMSAREDHSGHSHGVRCAVAPTAPPAATRSRGQPSQYMPDCGPQRERVATLITVEMTGNCGAGD